MGREEKDGGKSRGKMKKREMMETEGRKTERIWNDDRQRREIWNKEKRNMGEKKER